MDFIFNFRQFSQKENWRTKNFKKNFPKNENPHQKMWDRFSFSAKTSINSIFDQIIKSNIEFIDSICAKTKAPTLKYGETALTRNLGFFTIQLTGNVNALSEKCLLKTF